MNLSLRLLVGLAASLGSFTAAQDDPGKGAIGQVKVAVIYGTDGDPAVAGSRFKPVAKDIAAQLGAADSLKFKSYRFLGEDVQPLLRSYENWAQPLKPSDEVLLRFEARSHPGPTTARLDLELWLSRKKILKTDALLESGRPLFVLGPAWRGGRLIIAVSLASEARPGS